MTLAFDSTDLGETEEFLSTAYTKMRIGGQAERTRAQVSRESAGSLNVDNLAFDYDMAHDAREPIGKVCLCDVHSGGVVRRYFHGDEGTFGAGDVFMYAPHDMPYSGVIQAARYSLLMFDPLLLDQVAASHPARVPEPVRLTGDRPVSKAAARRLHALIIHVRDHVLVDPSTRDAPLLVAAASQLVAASVLDIFPNNALIEPTAADSRDAHAATVRRAVAYMEAHAHEPVMLADIAAAAGTTVRAVQAAFRRHQSMTPTAYLRRVRLDAARRDLQDADPSVAADPDVTVAAVAARWGFTSTAQFAHAYRQQYGTPPAHGYGHEPRA